MQQHTPFEYLLIEAANNKGLDKTTYAQQVKKLSKLISSIGS